MKLITWKKQIEKKINKNNFSLGFDVTNINFFLNKNNYFIKRFLTSYEYEEFLKIKTKKAKTKFLALRWVLKEAVFKALPASKKIFLSHFGFKKNEKHHYICLEFENIYTSITYYRNFVFCVALFL